MARPKAKRKAKPGAKPGLKPAAERAGKPGAKKSTPQTKDKRKPRAKAPARKTAAGSGAGPWFRKDDVWVNGDRATGRIMTARHPTAPFPAVWANPDDLGELCHAAGRYVRALASFVRANHPGWKPLLPLGWLDDLAVVEPGDPNRVRLTWLVDPDQQDPRMSFRAGLEPGPSHGVVVLLACLSVPVDGQPVPLFGRQGLRVVAQVRRQGAGAATVGFTSASLTVPLWTDARVRASGKTPWGPIVQQAFVSMVDSIPGVFGLVWGAHRITDLGVRLEDDSELSILAQTAPVCDDDDDEDFARGELLGYDLTGRLVVDVTGANPKLRIAPLTIRALLAHMSADAYAFKRDPITQFGSARRLEFKPNRNSQSLAPALEKVSLPNVAAPGDPLENDDVRVLNSVLAEPGAGTGRTKPLPDRTRPVPGAPNQNLPGNDPRTNASAAINAYYHASELFRRMRAYQLDPAIYFRFADRPLRVRYRAGLRPGATEGSTINSQVRWSCRPRKDFGVPGPLPFPIRRGRLEARLALADLALNPGAGAPWAATATPPPQPYDRRVPLGIACDARLAWHEFCHVLLAAATGDLEFRFAHSAGDAMAAILHDPDSALAAEGRWRFVTFPWITLAGRRHDREPALGWSWQGAMYQREVFCAGPHQLDRRGYWSEQILSTALFRLYRALGGDATDGAGKPDKPTRLHAADHALFLIMSAILLNGPVQVAPPQDPDQFVSALIDADLARTDVPTDVSNAPGSRLGGMAHKVIRWAFEEQGLYGPGSVGFPPPVDLYLEDEAGRAGGYAPPALGDGKWHASTGAVWVRHTADGGMVDQKPKAGTANFVYVQLGNRGGTAAPDAAVRVWVAKPSSSTSLPNSPAGNPTANGWIELQPGTNAIATVQVNGGGTQRFGPFAWPANDPRIAPLPGTSYALLAEATCTADRSNLDQASGLPCSQIAGRTDLLVAFDNNLGLRSVTAA